MAWRWGIAAGSMRAGRGAPMPRTSCCPKARHARWYPCSFSKNSPSFQQQIWWHTARITPPSAAAATTVTIRFLNLIFCSALQAGFPLPKGFQGK
jgi:hypothetical protein